ncbi:MAG: hypothetical protein HY054_13335 [Proteobacteria bacterium]|nr:hypothetical protein [Pseudomonadota bacterium]
MKVSSLRLALVFALALGLWHAGWAALVAASLAQPLLNWIFELHFLSQPFQVQPFNAVTARRPVARMIRIRRHVFPEQKRRRLTVDFIER